jgi:hypothetical protein
MDFHTSTKGWRQEVGVLNAFTILLFSFEQSKVLANLASRPSGSSIPPPRFYRENRDSNSEKRNGVTAYIAKQSAATGSGSAPKE